MSLLSFCDQAPAFVSLNATVADAIRTMIDRHAGAVAVVDDDHVVAGMFSERDVMKKFALSGRSADEAPVRDYMSQYVVMGSPETTPAEALAVMVESKHRHLPIVDAAGKLLAVVSIRHLLEAKVDVLTEQLKNAESDRPAPTRIQ